MVVKDLEEEFNKVQKETLVKIKEKMKIASDAISAAEKLSEKTGIPFYGSESPLGQPYCPASFQDKWGELPEEKLEELEGEFSTDYASLSEGYGWAHSSLC